MIALPAGAMPKPNSKGVAVLIPVLARSGSLGCCSDRFDLATQVHRSEQFCYMLVAQTDTSVWPTEPDFSRNMGSMNAQMPPGKIGGIGSQHAFRPRGINAGHFAGTVSDGPAAAKRDPYQQGDLLVVTRFAADIIITLFQRFMRRYLELTTVFTRIWLQSTAAVGPNGEQGSYTD